ncbi:MAG: YigZ family protein [Oscillospiraceae bacterium]|nr:YigZ family protein [Oscillospiraceae bacterium]
MFYKTIKKAAEDFFIEKKSRFIGYICPVSTEEEALAFIGEIRKKHADATHNVYAYVLRQDNIRRYSDNGEPSGTAGMPVLTAITGAGLTDVCVVVTRYFGGTLLGTGGLVRAYTEGAQIAIAAAGIVTMQSCALFSLSLDYSQYGGVLRILEEAGGWAENSEFGQLVELSAAVPEERVENFLKLLTDGTNGAVNATPCGISFRPLPQ